MQNVEVTSSVCWWGWLDKFWLAFYYLHDIPDLQIKFDNNQSGSFGESLYNKNRYRRQTDE